MIKAYCHLNTKHNAMNTQSSRWWYTENWNVAPKYFEQYVVATRFYI